MELLLLWGWSLDCSRSWPAMALAGDMIQAVNVAFLIIRRQGNVAFLIVDPHRQAASLRQNIRDSVSLMCS